MTTRLQYKPGTDRQILQFVCIHGDGHREVIESWTTAEMLEKTGFEAFPSKQIPPPLKRKP